MTIRWIPEAERRQAADRAREQHERDEVWWAFADWVEANSPPRTNGCRTFSVPPLSAEMITRLRAVMFGDQP